MILPIPLGRDISDNHNVVCLDPTGLSRHLHSVGATGTGKTTALHAVLRPLMADRRERCAMFVIDPMGNLSADLLRWIASKPRLQDVRRRLVYVEPARDGFVMPFNPLKMAVGDARYYHVARTVDLILRAWNAQDLSVQPRLMQWSYKAMAAVAALGFPIAMSEYLLHPGTDEHKAILRRIPPDIAQRWTAILGAQRGESERILESTRNRFEPFYDAPQAKRMFGTAENHFDVERFINERRIVIVNVAKLGKVPTQLGATIGALMVNEVFEKAYNMATEHGVQAVEPTYVVMDEFQKFVGPDLEDALPTVRQMGLRLILAHQSFSQLVQGDIDLSNIIWQAQNRLMFANSADDADIIANELAVLTFDPMQIKDQRTSLKQLITGYRTIWLEGESETAAHSDSVSDQHSVGYGQSGGEARRLGDSRPTVTSQHSRSDARVATGGTHADSQARSRSRGQHLMTDHKTIEEVSSITFRSFEEHRREWERIVRNLKIGEAFGRFANDQRLYHLLIDHNPVPETARIERLKDELIQRNFEQDLFISADQADKRVEQHRLQLLTEPVIRIPATTVDRPKDQTDPNPFATRDRT